MRGKDFGQAVPPEQLAPERAVGVDAERRRAAPPTLVADALDAVLAARAAQTGRAALDVVDVGAGTGGFAVRLAALGHQVTVVDPSPDALAAARWRAAELGVTLTAVQGEASDLAGAGRRGRGRPRGLPQRARVRRFAGRRDGRHRPRAAAGRDGQRARRQRGRGGAAARAGGPVRRGAPPARRRPGGSIPAPRGGVTEHRRFTLPELTALIDGAGLRVGEAHGIRVFAGLLPGAGADPNAADALRELEAAAAGYPALRDIAARLHIVAFRGDDRSEAAHGS